MFEIVGWGCFRSRFYPFLYSILLFVTCSVEYSCRDLVQQVLVEILFSRYFIDINGQNVSLPFIFQENMDIKILDLEVLEVNGDGFDEIAFAVGQNYSLYIQIFSVNKNQYLSANKIQFNLLANIPMNCSYFPAKLVKFKEIGGTESLGFIESKPEFCSNSCTSKTSLTILNINSKEINRIPINNLTFDNEFPIEWIDLACLNCNNQKNYAILLGQSMFRDGSSPYLNSHLVIVDIADQHIISHQRWNYQTAIKSLVGVINVNGQDLLVALPSTQVPDSRDFIQWISMDPLNVIEPFKLERTVEDGKFCKDGCIASREINGSVEIGLLVIDPPDTTKLRYIIAGDTWACWLNVLWFWPGVWAFEASINLQLGWTIEFAGNYALWSSSWYNLPWLERDACVKQTYEFRRSQKAQFTIGLTSELFSGDYWWTMDISGWRIILLSLWNANMYAGIIASVVLLATWGNLLAAGIAFETAAVTFIAYTLAHALVHVIGFGHLTDGGLWGGFWDFINPIISSQLTDKSDRSATKLLPLGHHK